MTKEKSRFKSFWLRYVSVRRRSGGDTEGSVKANPKKGLYCDFIKSFFFFRSLWWYNDLRRLNSDFKQGTNRLGIVEIFVYTKMIVVNF